MGAASFPPAAALLRRPERSAEALWALGRSALGCSWRADWPGGPGLTAPPWTLAGGRRQAGGPSGSGWRSVAGRSAPGTHGVDVGLPDLVREPHGAAGLGLLRPQRATSPSRGAHPRPAGAAAGDCVPGARSAAAGATTEPSSAGRCHRTHRTARSAPHASPTCQEDVISAFSAAGRGPSLTPVAPEETFSRDVSVGDSDFTCVFYSRASQPAPSAVELTGQCPGPTLARDCGAPAPGRRASRAELQDRP